LHTRRLLPLPFTLALALPRPLLSERAVLEATDGSAKWVQEGSAVLAAVHGPTQAGARREDAERALLQVLFKPRNGTPGER
jgi:exosome complex component RRP46